jgi:hypothetical protein
LDYYNAGASLVSGQVVVVGTIVGIVNGLRGIAAGEWGTLAVDGHVDFVKVTGALSVGDSVYWDADGDPVDGTAGTGAATATATGNTLIGIVEVAALSADTTVRVVMTSAQRTSTLAGSLGADDISGTDAILTIGGLQAAQGGSVPITGGTSTTAGNAGGAVSLTGGTPGATGVGGAASVVGGAGGSTSGTGGAVSLTGGAGTAGNANGGAVTINAGAKNGSGTDGAISIGTSNTASLTLGVMPRIPVAAVAAAGSIQGDAGALFEGFNVVSAADDTKGVVLPSAVAGMQVIIKSTVSNKILKVWPATGDAINAIPANSAMSLASGPTPVMLIAADATTWYTLPLLPS